MLHSVVSVSVFDPLWNLLPVVSCYRTKANAQMRLEPSQPCEAGMVILNSNRVLKAQGLKIDCF